MGSTARAALKFLALLLGGAALHLGWPTNPELNEAPPGDVAEFDDDRSAGLLPYLEATAVPEPGPDENPAMCDPERPFVPNPDRRLYATWRTFPLNRAEHGVDGTLRVLNDSRFTRAGFERRGTHPMLPPCDKLPGKLEVVDRDGNVVDALDVGPETDVMAYAVAPGQTLFEARELVQCLASCWCGDHERFLQVVEGHLRRLTTRSSKDEPLEVRGVTNGCYEAGRVARDGSDGSDAGGRFEVRILRTTMPDFARTWERHFWDGDSWRTAELPAKDRWEQPF